MTKSKSMIAVLAAIITICGAAEVGFAQRLFRPKPLRFRPLRFGRGVVSGSTVVGKAVVSGSSVVGKAIARPIGAIGRATVRGIGGPRLAYGPTYVPRYPPGYRTLTMGGYRYYYYSRLPIGYRTVWIGTHRYYVYNNVYYSPYNYRGSTIYLALPPPY